MVHWKRTSILAAQPKARQDWWKNNQAKETKHSGDKNFTFPDNEWRQLYNVPAQLCANNTALKKQYKFHAKNIWDRWGSNMFKWDRLRYHFRLSGNPLLLSLPSTTTKGVAETPSWSALDQGFSHQTKSLQWSILKPSTYLLITLCRNYCTEHEALNPINGYRWMGVGM